MTYGKYRHGVQHYIARNPDDKDNKSSMASLPCNRERDVLDRLISAGATGCTFFDNSAPRWASSIFRLRKRGVDIHTEMEPHSGKHARHLVLSEAIYVGENKNGA
ncbi:MAG: hypothetical protein ACK41U_00090 [Paracoccus sp. (in: a-proteobacteria)]|uniref:winged helix domain-containing protein n=1 Tax=Paracoccus sp. TaxID=267 RepID=UPI00391873CA